MKFVYNLFKGMHLIGTFESKELGLTALNNLSIDEEYDYQLEEHPLNVLTTKFNTMVIASR